MNTVGTFGGMGTVPLVPASAVGRVTQYCYGSQANTWHLRVADDYHLEASGPEYRPRTAGILCGMRCCWNPAVMAQNFRRRCRDVGGL